MSVKPIFKRWGKNRISKNRPWVEPPRKDPNVLAGVNPKLKQIAFDRLAILREFNLRLRDPGRPKTKTAVMTNFLKELNCAALWPDGIKTSILHVGRSTLYGWLRVYADGGLAALVPHYGVKPSTGQVKYRPLANPIEMKFFGCPRRNGKTEFIARLRRRWKIPALECPIYLNICYSMPVAKKTGMRRRMMMLNHRISHRGKPNLDALNAFIVDCLSGVAFRDHSQIVELHAAKEFAAWPGTRVLIKPLPG